jgi:arsenite methyltransferase
LRNLGKSSNKNTSLYIFDIFTNSSVAKFFDSYVSIACVTEHQVSFLTKDYAISMCKVTGWTKPEFIDIPLKWKFDTENDIGRFLSMMLSLKPEFTNNDTLQIANEILGYEKKATIPT